MNLKRRVEKLETHLFEDQEYKDCELEMVVGVDDEPGACYCRYPDGHRELITDNNVIQQLMDASNEISVEIVD